MYSCDLSSCSYLGFQHSASELEPWDKLTYGVPASALPNSEEVERVADGVANLLGAESATLGVSTFHMAWDIFGMLCQEGVAIYADNDVYPVTRWGVERAACRGVPVCYFPHYDVDFLLAELEKDAPLRLRPIIAADGVGLTDGTPAPCLQMLDAAERFGGHLIIDDTQALGVLGHSPTAANPYGRGGGGTLRWCGVQNPNVSVLGSMSKALGVPIAFLAGTRALTRWFDRNSETRLHCSPPSTAHLRAAARALVLNEVEGDGLRERLERNVRGLRDCLKQRRLSVLGGVFPVQTLLISEPPGPAVDAPEVHERLLQRGVRTLLRKASGSDSFYVSMVVTARHDLAQLERVTEIVFQELARAREGSAGHQTSVVLERPTNGQTDRAAPALPTACPLRSRLESV